MESPNTWNLEYILPDLIIIVGIRTRNKTNETNKKYHHIILISNNGITIGRPVDSRFVFSFIPVSMNRCYCNEHRGSFLIYMNVSKNNFSIVFACDSQRGSLCIVQNKLPPTYKYTFWVTYCQKSEVKFILMYKNKDSLFGTLWLR